MAEPRKAKKVRRIIRRAKTKKIKADLREFDRLIGERMDQDPSVDVSAAQRKAKMARERRLKLLGRRLLNATR
ncbi:hypothetical protein MA20_29915 [Bradyrhizobium japonicum]|uniref:Uncharacterized protein n=1 Tax=Bradyrhizobium japonicum TaxID=375 RepID=A0A0A3XSF8_BRAJP|nr:hypothetical protein [Bradyrhizobium japonicum]KGT76056.1 hypothetical protein MA20_29915 [Bradyrhizobium japonicum]